MRSSDGWRIEFYLAGVSICPYKQDAAAAAVVCSGDWCCITTLLLLLHHGSTSPTVTVQAEVFTCVDVAGFAQHALLGTQPSWGLELHAAVAAGSMPSPAYPQAPRIHVRASA
jgi:hypothetical protein